MGVTKLLMIKGGCVEMVSMLRFDVPVFVIVKFCYLLFVPSGRFENVMLAGLTVATAEVAVAVPDKGTTTDEPFITRVNAPENVPAEVGTNWTSYPYELGYVIVLGVAPCES